MKFVLDKRTFDILFNDAPVENVTVEEIAEAEKDLNRLQEALKKVKQKLLRILEEKSIKSVTPL